MNMTQAAHRLGLRAVLLLDRRMGIARLVPVPTSAAAELRFLRQNHVPVLELSRSSRALPPHGARSS